MDVYYTYDDSTCQEISFLTWTSPNYSHTPNSTILSLPATWAGKRKGSYQAPRRVCPWKLSAAERLGGKNTPQWSSNECHLCHNRCVTFILWEVTPWKSIYSCPVLSNPHSKPAFNKIPSFPCEIIVAKITRKILSHMKNILSSSCK